MRAVLQNSRTSPTAIDGVKQLAVYDEDDLLALMWEREDGTIALTRAGEPDFERLAAQMDLSIRSDVRHVKL